MLIRKKGRKMNHQTRKKPVHIQVHECEDHQSCRELISTLSDYVDGELSEELCAELEQHMKNCQRCRIVVDTMRMTIELYHETGAETNLPEDVRERLYLRLKLDDYLK